MVYDLIEYPYSSDNNWDARNRVLKGFIEDKESANYEYFDKTVWNETRNDQIISKELATENRMRDARELLNKFFEQIKPESALEKFLISCYSSFADEICRRNWLIKCDYCGRYIAFIRRKKYCSLNKEGRNCGKSVRNKRYYTTTGRKNLQQYRQKAQELRDFYKEKGVRK